MNAKKSPPKDAPVTDKDGVVTQAWTDDATGRTYLPGEKIEAADEQ